jgi:glycosyltransferase involved in cell wall biosynthesis
MPSRTILHFSTGKRLRGGERQVEFLHAGLAGAGVRSVLVCRKGGSLAARNLSDTIPLSWHGEWDARGLAGFISVCKRQNPALIHSHDGHSLAHASVAGALLGLPVVHTRRVMFPLRTSLFSQWKYGKCKAIIGVSEAVARACKEALPGVRVHIVHDGVDWTARAMSRSDARKALRIGENAFAIGSVAHFTKEKELPVLVSLAETIRTRSPAACIVCIGPVEKAALRVPPNMIFAGYRDDAALYYPAFDAYVSASPHEGLGSALLDAVVRDIPCVAVDGGGTRDMFPDGRELLKPGDFSGLVSAVTQMIDDYETACASAASCGKHAREVFSRQAMVQRTMEVYKTVAAL